ncbi:unnamed protein product [Cylicocyclus nassatus]|uniref:Uncharacterized protein n=1 Tax=Cylicocyclus nassatus TaxID=53992 RepID=A0AA36H4G4_CYLNA|nr:unnamed protein product [Cylicocyclus nassatus]
MFPLAAAAYSDEPRGCIHNRFKGYNGTHGNLGYPIEQDTIELHPLLNKNISELCGHARRQRFEKQDRKEFENYVADVFPMRKVQRKLRNTRNLVLFLVENCTAWLYLTKPIGNSLKVAISDLFFLLLDIQRRIPEDR